MSNKKRRLQRVNRQQIIILAAIALIGVLAYSFLIERKQTVELYFERPDGSQTVKFQADLAATEDTRTRGLMFVKELPPRRGMLFTFPSESLQSFWMKNTYIPLDIIFIDSERRVVGIVPDARPLTDKKREIQKPSRYVLELNAGEAREYNIIEGARLMLSQELGNDIG